MKNSLNIRYILLALGLMLLSSCDDWLDEGSSTQIKADDVYKTESGFQDALIGVYLNLASSDLYGKNLSWYFVDILAQPYDVTASDAYNLPYKFKNSYTDLSSKACVDAIWLKAYNTIANINAELRYVEKDNSVLSPISRNLIKGELLALRAYVHLDILRLYGYGDLQNREDYTTRPTIPYVTVYSKERTDQLPYKETLGLLINDIKDALTYLKDDPIRNLQSSNPEYYAAINGNMFWENRQRRMNYYAAQALLARAYMWEGSDASLEEAYKIAKSLTEQENVVYSWIKASEVSGSRDRVDRTFSGEHLFSLHVYDAYTIFNPYMVNPNESKYPIFIQQKAYEEAVFESNYHGSWGYYYAPNHPDADASGLIYLNIPSGANSIVGEGKNDYRFNYHGSITELGARNVYYITKLYQPDGYIDQYKERVPMIKITEMFYIMAEYLMRIEKDDNAALAVLNQVRSKRGISANIDTDMMISVQSELNKEYMREFLQEGQLFYYFKRLNILDPTYYQESSGYAGIENYSFNERVFLLPYPDDEIINGGREQ